MKDVISVVEIGKIGIFCIPIILYLYMVDFQEGMDGISMDCQSYAVWRLIARRLTVDRIVFYY